MTWVGVPPFFWRNYKYNIAIADITPLEFSVILREIRGKLGYLVLSFVVVPSNFRGNYKNRNAAHKPQEL